MKKSKPKLVWDEWNTKHISKHNVGVYEIEQVVKDKNAVYLTTKKGRQLLLGRFKKRLVSVVINKDERSDRYYVVTARDMDKKERSLYRKNDENN